MRDFYFPPSPEPNPNNLNSTNITPTINPEYMTAVDEVARLLYYLGKDLNVVYGSQSGAYWSDAIQLLQELSPNVEVVNEIYSYYNTGFRGVCSRILLNELVLLNGQDTISKKYHGWVADGLGVRTISATGNIATNYVHFDWGWAGECNGYYCEGVFSAKDYVFKAISYTSVKCMTND